MKKQTLLVLLLLFFGIVNAKELEYNQVFFENSLMKKSWFYSETSYQSPSFVLNIQGKLPVENKESFTPGNSLQLAYQSAPDGQWSARLNFPKWRGKDFIKKGNSLFLHLYVADGTSRTELPNIIVELKNKETSKALSLAGYLKNYSSRKWMEVKIPLKDFEEDSPIKLQHSGNIQSIVFQQASADGKSHHLFIDQVEILPKETDTQLPTMPVLKTVKGYERHVDLSWNPVNPENVKYVKIYRSEDNIHFQPVAVQSPQYASRYADFTGLPGKTYYYKISYLNYRYRESELSPSVKATTHAMTDDELLDMVQKACFRYYWEGAEANSGLALEDIPGRKDMIATGASGFGLMALIVGTERGFITRDQLIQRLTKIVSFIEKADRFHGALPHFLDGPTGNVEPYFGKYDDGGDLVETSFFMQGLLAARQFLNPMNTQEEQLRNRMTKIWEGVEWNWYKQTADSPFLYWHWSPDYAWHINHRLIGWNETMITYLLAIASPMHSVSPKMYYSGWASQDTIAQKYRSAWGKSKDGSMYTNRKTFYGVNLAVGVNNGGPLFFTHYSYMGFNPHLFQDKYTNYFDNNRNIALINYRYCCENPKDYNYYGEDCWGLTASDGPWGYKAREPLQRMDDGTIAPTGAIASFPYLPEASMKALKYYYRDCGSFLWGEYGFRDAFNLQEDWCANIYMGLNQAPMVVMIENYRAGLIWKLFMQNKEVQKALQELELKSKKKQ